MKTVNVILIGLLLAGLFNLTGLAIAPGEKAENFSLPDYNGKMHSLSDYQSKAAIVLIFISTRCPVSNAYSERMAQLYDDYTPKNVIFLGINSNRQEPVQDIKTHAQKNNLRFTILKDEGNAVADQFNAAVTPEVFVLDKELRLVYHGHIDDSQRPAQVKKEGLRSALDEFLAGKAVSDKVTKPFGCSIKRER